MNISDYAARVRRLRQDETLMMVFRDIKEDAAAVFLNPNSDAERVLEAHSAIVALGYIERRFDAIDADRRIKEKEQ